MEITYKFYVGYTDINRMNECMFFQQFSRRLNDKFNPPYLRVTFPSNMEEDVLLRSEEFIVNTRSERCYPTKIIEVPCENTDFENVEVKNILRRYKAVSFRRKKGALSLDIPIYESMDIEKDYW